MRCLFVSALALSWGLRLQRKVLPCVAALACPYTQVRLSIRWWRGSFGACCLRPSSTGLFACGALWRFALRALRGGIVYYGFLRLRWHQPSPSLPGAESQKCQLVYGGSVV